MMRRKPTLYDQISEKAFLFQVITLARHLQWRVAHFRPGLTQRGKWVTAVQGDGKGFPDLVLVRGKRLIFAELKSAKGKPDEEQMIWLAMLGGSAEAYLWKPADIEEIERILK